MNLEKIRFSGDGEDLELFVLDSTRLAGKEYLLVTDVEEGDGNCYILEDISAGSEAEACYRMVEDDRLLDYLAGIFGEQLEELDIEY